MTMIKEGYKETEIGVIPEEWDVDTFENICVPKGMVRGPFGGALKKEFFVQSGYKVYEQKNAINKDASIGEYYIDQEKFEELKRFEVKTKDFIVSCSGTIGKIYQIPENHEKGIINQALLKITTNPDIIYDLFFYNYFEWDNFQRKIIDNTQGGAMKNLVGMDIIKKTPFSIPPLLEQQRIAEILSTTDSHIEMLDKTIEDYQLLKKGMMKKLLTEGIGHTEFKETEIGKIPKEWEVRQLQSIADVKGGKRLPKGVELQDENSGFPYIRVADMFQGGVKLSDIKYVPSDAEPAIKNYKISKEDIFISVAGTLGVIGIIPEELDNANLTENADKICNIKCDKKYLMYYLQAPYLQNIINNERTLGAQPKLALNRIQRFLIGLPQRLEQQRIADILSTIDMKVNILENQRQDFFQLKKSLMEKLLTGKVRV